MQNTFSLGMSSQNLKISIDRGIECNGEYLCRNNNDQSKIHIVKKESADLSYKVTLIYDGIRDSRSNWTLLINDKLPTTDYNFSYEGSKIINFKAIDKETLLVEEKDEHETTSRCIDISGENYKVISPNPLNTVKIQTLIRKGKIFKPADGKEIKKIFYSKNDGIFLYARDNAWNGDIYHAHEDAEEFSKCESQRVSQSRSPVGNSTWAVSIPTRITPLILEFPEGKVEESVEKHILLKVHPRRKSLLQNLDPMIENNSMNDDLPELEQDV